jgi:hypothetical protein
MTRSTSAMTDSCTSVLAPGRSTTTELAHSAVNGRTTGSGGHVRGVLGVQPFRLTPMSCASRPARQRGCNPRSGTRAARKCKRWGARSRTLSPRGGGVPRTCRGDGGARHKVQRRVRRRPSRQRDAQAVVADCQHAWHLLFALSSNVRTFACICPKKKLQTAQNGLRPRRP